MLKICLACSDTYTKRHPDAGRCPDCSALFRSTQPTTAQKGLGSRWQIAAREQIRREPMCAYCGAVDDLTADHLVPRAKGGTIADGLVTACRPCNSRRGAGRKET